MGRNKRQARVPHISMVARMVVEVWRSRARVRPWALPQVWYVCAREWKRRPNPDLILASGHGLATP